MQIILTRGQEALVYRAIATGRLSSAEDAVTDALLLWEDQERARGEFLGSMDAARDAIVRGEGVEITSESMRSLAEDVKRRGRERRAAEA
jgi:Arc/MetJ-type ribon-helix-helix transcriptional regulator